FLVLDAWFSFRGCRLMASPVSKWAYGIYRANCRATSSTFGRGINGAKGSFATCATFTGPGATPAPLETEATEPPVESIETILGELTIVPPLECGVRRRFGCRRGTTLRSKIRSKAATNAALQSMSRSPAAEPGAMP